MGFIESTRFKYCDSPKCLYSGEWGCDGHDFCCDICDDVISDDEYVIECDYCQNIVGECCVEVCELCETTICDDCVEEDDERSSCFSCENLFCGDHCSQRCEFCNNLFCSHCLIPRADGKGGSFSYCNHCYEVYEIANSFVRVKKEIKELKLQEKELKKQLVPMFKDNNIGILPAYGGDVKYYTNTGYKYFNYSEVLTFIAEKYGSELAQEIELNCTKTSKSHSTLTVTLHPSHNGNCENEIDSDLQYFDEESEAELDEMLRKKAEMLRNLEIERKEFKVKRYTEDGELIINKSK